MSEETTTTETTEAAPSAAPAGGGDKQRPVFLTVLCILSFIAIGFGVLAYIGAFAALSLVSAAVDGVSDAVLDAGGTVTEGPGTGMIWAYIIVGFLTTIVSLIGVIKMWKLQKQGFMLYTAAAIISIIMSILYVGFSASITGIIISGAFIVMYYLNVKHME